MPSAAAVRSRSRPGRASARCGCRDQLTCCPHGREMRHRGQVATSHRGARGGVHSRPVSARRTLGPAIGDVLHAGRWARFGASGINVPYDSPGLEPPVVSRPGRRRDVRRLRAARMAVAAPAERPRLRRTVSSRVRSVLAFAADAVAGAAVPDREPGEHADLTDPGRSRYCPAARVEVTAAVA